MNANHIDRSQGTRQHTHSKLTRERFRSFFQHCPRCGIVRDLRYGKYLSEPDSQELEAICSDFNPTIPTGDLCPWCAEETQGGTRRMS